MLPQTLTLFLSPLLTLLLTTPLTTASPARLPSNVPSTQNYPTTKPLHTMDLQLYRGSASAPCAGPEAYNLTKPQPLTSTNCIFTLPPQELPNQQNLICVKRRVDDGKLNGCIVVGYLEEMCRGEEIVAGRKVVNGAWIWGLGTGKTIDIRSMRVKC